jgi:hypothetical protein
MMSCLIYKKSLFLYIFFFFFLVEFFYWDTPYLEEFRAALLLLANTLNTFYKLSLAIFPHILKLKLEISCYSRSPLVFLMKTPHNHNNSCVFNNPNTTHP